MDRADSMTLADEGILDETGHLHKILEDPSRRWLLIAGGRLSASSGVPLPTMRTRWAPSIKDLVQHHTFKTQTREVFASVDKALDEGRPPLGYVADTLQGQAAWLDTFLTGLSPHTPALRVADLARAGMFRAIVSSAPDHLLDQSLEMVGIDFQEITLENPTLGEGGALPLLREWDHRIFLDTHERTRRENAFVKDRLDTLVKDVDGVLVLGHSPFVTDLIEALSAAIETEPELEVVWVDEALFDNEPSPAPEHLSARHTPVTRVSVQDIGQFLDHIAEIRGAQKSPLIAISEPEASLISRVMNQSFDIRPVLIFVPGVALFSGLIERLPRMSLKMVLSVLALLVTIVGYFNYSIFREYRDQIRPVEAHIEHAQEALGATNAHAGAIMAEGALKEAEDKMALVVLPWKTFFSLSILHVRIEQHFEDTRLKIRDVRHHEVIPVLYLNRLGDSLGSDPSVISLGDHPPVEVVPGHDVDNARRIWLGRKPISAYKISRPVSNYDGEQRMALFSSSAPLLQITMQKDMLRTMKEGRLAIEVDLANTPPGPLEGHMFDNMRRVAGYEGARRGLFGPSGLIERLSKGQCTLYFTHIDASSVPLNLARIENLQERFPKCRALISVITEKTLKQVREKAPRFSVVTLTDYTWVSALAHLRDKTSEAFTQKILEDTHMRWGLTDPLVLSLLIDHHRYSTTAPRSLAQVYDRLLQKMLSRGESGFVPKLKALGVLAYELLSHDGDALTRWRAIRLVADAVFKTEGVKTDPRHLYEERASAMLDELVHNGVLRYQGETSVSFMGETFLNLAAARHLEQLSLQTRKAFLLSNDEEIVAFHAGLLRNSTDLVEALISDYLVVDEALRARDLHKRRVNLYQGALRLAALAVQNGQVDHALVVRLEDLLFELAEHAVSEVANEARTALSCLSTPGLQKWVLVGIESDRLDDHMLMDLAARAPSDIYVGAIDRWLRRVGTEADARRESRFEPNSTETPPEMTFKTHMGMLNGLSTLVQVGTPDALRFVEEHVTRESDPRFAQTSWRHMRVNALRLLIQNKHYERVRPHLSAIEKDPALWKAILDDLYVLNDVQTARTLVSILRQPEPVTSRTIEHKDLAARSLAFMDRDVTAAALEAFFETPMGESHLQNVTYGLRALGYRGDPEDMPLFEKVTLGILGPEAEAKKIPRGMFEAIYRALAMIGTAEAFALFETLQKKPGLKVSMSSARTYLFHFRSAEAERYLLRGLLCLDAPVEERLREGRVRPYLQTLGRMGTDSARKSLNKLLLLIYGQRDARYLQDLCGEDVALKLVFEEIGAWRGLILDGIVGALVGVRHPEDLPRFARWAMDKNEAVRRRAIEGLGHYKNPVATEAIVESASAFVPDEPSQRHALKAHLDALHRQGLTESSPHLVKWLAMEGLRKSDVLHALRTSGDLEAFLAVSALQGDPSLAPNTVQRSLFHIARRILGQGVEPHRLTEPRLELER